MMLNAGLETKVDVLSKPPVTFIPTLFVEIAFTPNPLADRPSMPVPTVDVPDTPIPFVDFPLTPKLDIPVVESLPRTPELPLVEPAAPTTPFAFVDMPVMVLPVEVAEIALPPVVAAFVANSAIDAAPLLLA
jgi:hypothetical protein